MRTIGMGELEEIGRNGWSGKSQLLTGWLCDGWFLVLVCFGLWLSGFGLEFGDGGVALTDFFAGFLALQICFFCDFF